MQEPSESWGCEGDIARWELLSWTVKRLPENAGGEKYPDFSFLPPFSPLLVLSINETQSEATWQEILGARVGRGPPPGDRKGWRKKRMGLEGRVLGRTVNYISFIFSLEKCFLYKLKSFGMLPTKSLVVLYFMKTRSDFYIHTHKNIHIYIGRLDRDTD